MGSASTVLHSLKRLGQRSPTLRHLWGLVRWYTTPIGVQQIITSIRHIGWAVKCPICGWRGSSFYQVPYGSPVYKIYTICPRCGAYERQRLLALYFEQSTALKNRPLRVLEVAPGRYSSGLFRKLPQAMVVTLDREQPLAQVRADITDLPFRPELFDLVVCYHVLEHVLDDHRAMTELRRVVRQDGLCFVDVPIEREVTYEDPRVTDPQDRLRLFGQEDHVRSYGKDFVNRMARAGLEVRQESLVATLPPSIARRCGLDPEAVMLIGQRV